jgi:hypothetical protein
VVSHPPWCASTLQDHPGANVDIRNVMALDKAGASPVSGTD